MKSSLEAYLDHKRRLVEEALAHVFDDETPASIPAALRQAVDYSLLGGGKRLRPVLALSSCEAAGGRTEAALPLACALEMIHTYSLIHDDLPAMDDDDFRRGRPTSHKAHGEALAILAGDALLTDAFRVLAQAPAAPELVLRALRELSQAAGAAGMVGGQVLDVQATGQALTPEQLTRLHRMKTGALLLCSVRGGAILGGADEDTLARLHVYGEALGLAFQIVDDVLDVTADLATLGKDPGSDRDAGKRTFVDLLGIEGARRRAQEVMGAGIAAIAPLGERAGPLIDLGHYTVERDR